VTNLSLFDAAPIVDVQPAVTPSRIDGVVRLISAKAGAFRELRNGEPTGREFYMAELELFDALKYRFVATATPSPNRYKELIHYAGFLGVMDTGQALTRFFQRDSTQANNLTLYPHMEEEFFVWLHSWALFVQRPSDLGYSDEGYDLPPLKVIYHELPTPAPVGKFDRDGQAKMIADAALSLKDAADEKRESIPRASRR
jgi:hypothetical protein